MKAEALTKKFPEHLIIGSDQVAQCNGEILNKPQSHENAAIQLNKQSGNKVLFNTAICILNSSNGELLIENIVTEVKFKSLSQAEIQNYLVIEKPYDCAGSFKAEGLGICLFESIRSDDPTALIGLPLIKTVDFLSKMNISCLKTSSWSFS